MIRNPASRSLVVRRTFTLIEMLVAIGIIVILAVITVSATVALVERSEISATQNIFKLLDTAVIEWEAQSDRKITWGKQVEGGPSYDMYDAVPHVFTLSEILYRIGRVDAVKSIVAQIKPEVLYRFDPGQDLEGPGWLRLRQQGDPDPNFSDAIDRYMNGLNGREVAGMLAVLDPWGTPIRAVHPGRASDFVLFGDNDPDDDGTIPLEVNYLDGTYGVEEFYGKARDRRILFVSAGPDGQFGSVGADPDGSPQDQMMHDWSHDNVVSYAIEDSHQ